MGFKAIKEKYKIEHVVRICKCSICKGGICIGSPYIHNIIVIDKKGKIIKGDEDHRNDDLNRYLKEIKEDQKIGYVKRLVNIEDMFGKTIPVYTAENGRVIKKFCEKIGWPNITTDGELQYDNTFFQNKKEAKQYAKSETKYEVKSCCVMFRDSAKDMWKKIKYLLSALYHFLRARIF